MKILVVYIFITLKSAVWMLPNLWESNLENNLKIQVVNHCEINISVQ